MVAVDISDKTREAFEGGRKEGVIETKTKYFRPLIIVALGA